MILLWFACAGDPVLDLTGNVDSGALTWQDECGLCHGQQGEGTSRGGTLVDVFDRLDEEEVLDAVRFGVSSMPPYQERLSDQDLADLLAWMHENL